MLLTVLYIEKSIYVTYYFQILHYHKNPRKFYALKCLRNNYESKVYNCKLHLCKVSEWLSLNKQFSLKLGICTYYVYTYNFS